MMTTLSRLFPVKVDIAPTPTSEIATLQTLFVISMVLKQQRPWTNTHVSLRSSYDHAFKFESRPPPPYFGVVQSVVTPRRGDTELSTPSAVRISSMATDTPRSSPSQQSCRASRKLIVDKTCHVIDHCDVLRGPSSVGDPALAISPPV